MAALFNYGDIVSFDITHEDKTVTLTGEVCVIDANGTFERPGVPSYDILVQNSPHFDGQPCLYKHIEAKGVTLIEKADKPID